MPQEQQMSPQDFAKTIKAKYPVYASVPDDELTRRVLAKYPQYQSRVTLSTSNVRPDTAVDKMFPQGATVSAPHPRTGLAGIEDSLSNLRTRLSMSAQKGVGQGVGDFMESLPLGILRLLKGWSELPQGKIWKGTKDIVGGGLEAGTIPLSFAGPESSAKKIGSVAVEDAAKVITNAVNPVANKMAVYQSELAKHLDKIVTFAAQKGINIDSIEGLWKAMKESGDSIRAHYYEKILGPVKDVPIDISGIEGYSGKVSSPSTATLAQLDSRLSQINAELSPKFAKGGIAAQAAVKSAGDLNAEAGAIRSVLYPRLGQASGLDAQVVAQTRGSFGSLDNLAEQTKIAADQARHAANVSSNAPITVNPFAGSAGKQFVADKAVNAIRGNPIAKAIRQAVSKADVPRYALPEPSPAAARSVLKPPRVPIRGGSAPTTPIAETSAAERGAVAQKLDARRAVNAAAKKKAELEKASEELKKLMKSTRHPMWQGQLPE